MPPDRLLQTASNGTTNGTTNGTSGGDGVFPGGWELLSSALQGALDSLTNGVQFLIERFNYHLLTLPAAGDPAAPATWTAFEDPYWIAVATVYGMFSAFVLPLVWGVGWFNVAYPRGVQRRERLKDVGKALFLIVGGWPLLQFWLHFWNQSALAFAPSAAEFFATPGNTAKLGVGVLLGVAILAYNSLIILAGLLIHLLFVFLTFVTVALWPLSVALYLSDVYAVDTVGSSGIAATLLLSPLQFVKAALLRLIFEFPLKPTDPETMMSLLLIAIGITVAFVGIPYFGLKRLLPRSIVTVGRRQRRRRQRERVGNLRDRMPSGGDLKARVKAVGSDSGSRLGQRGGDRDGSSLQSRSSSSTSSRNSTLYSPDDTRTRTQTVGNQSRADNQDDRL